MNQMYNDGVKDELIVMEMTEKHFGGSTVKANKYEDTQMHVDFWWFDDNGAKYGIDVKGIKKNNRHDQAKDSSIHWVELQNVRGDKGWVYGESTYIAFLTSDCVLFVPRKRLANYVESTIQGKELVGVNPKECYIPYQRRGRLDIIVKIPTSDLHYLAKHKISIT